MISDLNFHLTIRTVLQGESFLFSKENDDTYNPTTNGDSCVFFFVFCVLAALPTTPADFFGNSSADCCVEVQISFDGATATAAIRKEAKDSDDIIAAINTAYAAAVGRLPYFPEYED